MTAHRGGYVVRDVLEMLIGCLIVLFLIQHTGLHKLLLHLCTHLRCYLC